MQERLRLCCPGLLYYCCVGCVPASNCSIALQAIDMGRGIDTSEQRATAAKLSAAEWLALGGACFFPRLYIFLVTLEVHHGRPCSIFQRMLGERLVSKGNKYDLINERMNRISANIAHESGQNGQSRIVKDSPQCWARCCQRGVS